MSVVRDGTISLGFWKNTPTTSSAGLVWPLDIRAFSADWEVGWWTRCPPQAAALVSLSFYSCPLLLCYLYRKGTVDKSRYFVGNNGILFFLNCFLNYFYKYISFEWIKNVLNIIGQDLTEKLINIIVASLMSHMNWWFQEGWICFWEKKKLGQDLGDLIIHCCHIWIPLHKNCDVLISIIITNFNF